MGQQQVPGAFPARSAGFSNITGANINLVDFVGATVAWSPGATILTPLGVQPPLGQKWTVTSWQIIFNGLLQPGTPPMYGKLGRLIGGLVHGSSSTAQPSTLPWASPALQLPPDAPSLAVMWDGQNDPIFPANLPSAHTQTQPLMPTVHTEIPATPIEIQAGESLSIGMWLEPSLATSTLLAIINSTYCVTFDDGLQSSPGWGQ